MNIMIYTHLSKGFGHQEEPEGLFMVQTISLGCTCSVSSKEEIQWAPAQLRQPEGKEGFHLHRLQGGKFEGFEG